MPADKDKNLIRCVKVGCHKVLGEGFLNDGKISIKCKCGLMNTIEATPAPVASEKFIYNQPYQHRLNLVRKD